MTNLQAVIIAIGIAFAGVGFSVAQQTSPNVLPGCIFNSVAPSLTNLQSSPLQCDSSGRLKVTTTP
jgi:hypothetical protein